MADPWFKFYPSDWLAGTRVLSPAETGIYVTLVAMMYERRAPLDMDRARLARLCCCTAGAFGKILDALIDAGKIQVVDGGLWNARTGIEIKERVNLEQNAEGASNARWRKHREKTQEKQGMNGTDALRAVSERNAIPEARSHIERDEGKPSSCPFSEFWKIWPNKVAKTGAESAWKKLPEADRLEALARVTVWFDGWRRQNPQASPIHAATYLNKRRWQDEAPVPQSGINGVSNAVSDAQRAADLYRRKRGLGGGEDQSPAFSLLPPGE